MSNNNTTVVTKRPNPFVRAKDSMINAQKRLAKRMSSARFTSGMSRKKNGGINYNNGCHYVWFEYEDHLLNITFVNDGTGKFIVLIYISLFLITVYY